MREFTIKLRKIGKFYHYRIKFPGIPRYEGTTHRTGYREALKEAHRIARDLGLSPESLTLEQALTKLAEHKILKGDSDATLEILELKGRHLVGFFGPEFPIAEITKRETTEYLKHRRDEGAHDSTIAKEVGELRQALRHLSPDLYYGDPRAIWPPALSQTFAARERWLTYDEYLRVLSAIRPQWRDHLQCYVYLGVRCRELYLILGQHVERDRVHVPTPKTAKRGISSRWIPINAEIAPILRRRAQEPSKPLFELTSPGFKEQKNAWYRALQRACERADVPPASSNDLRRTFCTWGMQAGVSKDEMVRWMGHKRGSKMVDEVYSQPSVEIAKREIAKLPARRRSAL